MFVSLAILSLAVEYPVLILTSHIHADAEEGDAEADGGVVDAGDGSGIGQRRWLGSCLTSGNLV